MTESQIKLAFNYMPINHFGTFIKHEHGANFVNTMREVAKNKEMNIVEIDCNQLILDENIVFEAVAENRGKKTLYLFDDFNMLDEDKQQRVYNILHNMKMRMDSLLNSFYVFGILVDQNWNYGEHELALDSFYTDHGVVFKMEKDV
jgi:hypothetical protein